ADGRADASDEALVSLARNGDRCAFGALYERYARMVHGILLARVPAQVAEDLLQDVFLQVLPRLGSLRDPTRFGGWLAAIARNRAHDHHRRSRPMEQWSESSAAKDAKQAPGESVFDGMLLLEGGGSLPEGYRETVSLGFWGRINRKGMWQKNRAEDR